MQPKKRRERKTEKKRKRRNRINIKKYVKKMKNSLIPVHQGFTEKNIFDFAGIFVP